MKNAAVKSTSVLTRRLRNRSDEDEVKELAYRRYLMRQLNCNESVDWTVLRSAINRLTYQI